MRAFFYFFIFYFFILFIMAHTPRRGICNGAPVQICDSWQLTDILTALQRQSDCCCPFPSNWEIDDIEERTDTFNVNFINGVWSNQILTQTVITSAAVFIVMK